MSVKLSKDFIRRLPKTDLHVHLDGSLRLETILELAREQGVELPAMDPDGLAKAMHVGENTGSLVKYLEAFGVTLRVLQRAGALRRAAYELAEDAAGENVRYMEVRYAPMLHTQEGMKLTEVVETVLAGLADAERDHGIHSRLILCGIRNISPESSLAMAELVVAYKGRGVVGFDLAGAEDDHPARAHQEAFNLVRRNNINVTIHAGEAYGPASIAQAIHDCGAHRIGHGCRLREDGDLLRYVVDHRVSLECCPSSNLQTGAVASLDTHPMRLYYDLGARVTINTDNRLITDTTVTQELLVLHEQLGFTFEDLARVLLNGVKSAFLPFHERKRLLESFMRELESIRAIGLVDALASKGPPSGSQESA
jgi:adenosine deaminase